jgi:hypothetical protein
MAQDSLTADQVHAHAHELRGIAARPPQKIALGVQQRAALEAAQRAAAGTDDIGPLTEFQGLPIVKSRKDNWVGLLGADETGDDAEVEVTEPVAPSGPEAPAVEEQSGG